MARPSRGAWVAVVVPLLLAAAPPTHDLADLDARRQARATAREADEARGRLAADEVKALQGRLVALGAKAGDGRRSLHGARARLRQLNVQEAALKLRMGRNQQSLTRLLGALQLYQRDPPPALMVNPRSAREAVRATLLIQAITPELRRRAQDFAAQAEALTRLRRQADAASGTLFQSESAEADREARIQDTIDQKRALEGQFRTDAGVARADVQRLAARARSLGELVQTLGEHDPAGLHDVDPAGPRRMTPPVPGPPMRAFAQAGPDPRHAQGLTWAADPNATVLSPAAAMVDYAGPLKGWGLVLILRAGEYHLVMGGLGSVATEAGREVAAGEPVGRMPGEGRPELYLELRRGGRPVDPGRWFAPAPAGISRG